MKCYKATTTQRHIAFAWRPEDSTLKANIARHFEIISRIYSLHLWCTKLVLIFLENELYKHIGTAKYSHHCHLFDFSHFITVVYMLYYMYYS